MINKMLLGIVIFLIVGALIIKIGYDLSFSEQEDTFNFITKYASWVFQLGRNTVDVTGYAVKKDWLPVNETTNESIPVRLTKP